LFPCESLTVHTSKVKESKLISVYETALEAKPLLSKQFVDILLLDVQINDLIGLNLLRMLRHLLPKKMQLMLKASTSFTLTLPEIFFYQIHRFYVMNLNKLNSLEMVLLKFEKNGFLLFEN
jgi:DNA-binding LytR/AlgR family response regulator